MKGLKLFGREKNCIKKWKFFFCFSHAIKTMMVIMPLRNRKPIMVYIFGIVMTRRARIYQKIWFIGTFVFGRFLGLLNVTTTERLVMLIRIVDFWTKQVGIRIVSE